MNWLYALLFFLLLFIAIEKSPRWGEGIIRIKFLIRRIIPNLPFPSLSQLKSKLFIFVRILSTTWDAQFQFSYSAHSSMSRIFFSNQLFIHTRSSFIFHYFMFSFFIFSRFFSFFHCPLVVLAFAPDRVKEHHLRGEAEEYHL